MSEVVHGNNEEEIRNKEEIPQIDHEEVVATQAPRVKVMSH